MKINRHGVLFWHVCLIFYRKKLIEAKQKDAINT